MTSTAELPTALRAHRILAQVGALREFALLNFGRAPFERCDLVGVDEPVDQQITTSAGEVLETEALDEQLEAAGVAFFQVLAQRAVPGSTRAVKGKTSPMRHLLSTCGKVTHCELLFVASRDAGEEGSPIAGGRRRAGRVEGHPPGHRMVGSSPRRRGHHTRSDAEGSGVACQIRPGQGSYLRRRPVPQAATRCPEATVAARRPLPFLRMINGRRECGTWTA